MKKIVMQIVSVMLLAGNALGQAQILWDEAVNGPLSSSSQSRTYLPTIIVGSNILTASVEATPSGGGWSVVNDYFVITIPSDLTVSFIQFHSDRPVVTWFGNEDFSEEVASVINPSSGNLLSQLGLPLLPSGVYGIYFSNFDFQPSPTVANYTLDFFAQPVPEPSTYALLLLGVVSVACVRRLRSRASRSP